MRRNDDQIEEIRGLLRTKKALSLQGISERTGMSERTTQRYLKYLEALTSYTHKRRFVTLPDLPRFDDNGIWFYRQVGFSRFGNGLDTLISLINGSREGFSREELEAILKIGLSKQIQILVQREKIHRIKLGNKYLYVPEKVMHNKKVRFKYIGDRQIEEHFEKDIQKTDLIALLKAVLVEKRVGVDIVSIKCIAQKYSLRIPFKKIERLLLKYNLTEKKTP